MINSFNKLMISLLSFDPFTLKGCSKKIDRINGISPIIG